ncbi:MAG: nuclear transport factor 2 family protein [Solirubrobacterales bacterium]
MDQDPVTVEVIERFYEAFSQGDGDTMATCYHPDVHFSDPVFTDLNGPEVMKMWRALLSKSNGLDLKLTAPEANGKTGSAHWTARYKFSKTGREVVNEIDARFTFKDGLIIDHIDSFDFWKWSRQALGAPGLLLGWSPIVKKKVRAESAQLLASSD